MRKGWENSEGIDWDDFPHWKGEPSPIISAYLEEKGGEKYLKEPPEKLG